MSFDTIDLLTGNKLQVTWDLGRRCNYDCSYCPAHRHDNFSPHATLEELKANTKFLFEYVDIYLTHRKLKKVGISFTGGEPTVNPKFIQFSEFLRQEYKRYEGRWEAELSLTTNGAMGPKQAEAIKNNFDFMTISYHAEADKKMKQQIRDRILQFKDYRDNWWAENHDKDMRHKFWFKINVMFHAEYFEECKELSNWLDEIEVEYTPRVIGEWEDTGSLAHKYTETQLQWFKDYWRHKKEKLNKDSNHSLKAVGEKTTEKKKLGMEIGRPCCGNREMCLSNKGKDGVKSTFVDNTTFKGWHCSVNWFFLHLEQQTDQVFHHQTCQARFDGTRGPIGKISEGDKIIKNLKKMFAENNVPTIICPKQTCSCGLCAPKSSSKESYFNTIKNHVDVGVLRT